MSGSAELKVGRRKVQLSNLGKVLYPDADFRKADVIEYYVAIAPVMIPHLKNRPVTLKRYPNGVEGKFFFEKQCPSHKPDWVPTEHVISESSSRGAVDYCLVNEPATLVWLANLAALELHTLLSRKPGLNQPTMMVFDLDPGAPATVIDSGRVAIRLRDLFEEMKLRSFAKTSGSKGIHLYVPLNTKVTFEQTKQFAQATAMLLEKRHPDKVTSVMKRDIRGGKVLIDWSQNDDHKTTASVYTLRARIRPTVSTPINWDELERAVKRNDPKPITFEARQVLKRVEKLGDLFEPVLKLKQKLPRL
jgi:bifunctional non-homologous end joining protein LigD